MGDDKNIERVLVFSCVYSKLESSGPKNHTCIEEAYLFPNEKEDIFTFSFQYIETESCSGLIS